MLPRRGARPVGAPRHPQTSGPREGEGRYNQSLGLQEYDVNEGWSEAINARDIQASVQIFKHCWPILGGKQKAPKPAEKGRREGVSRVRGTSVGARESSRGRGRGGSSSGGRGRGGESREGKAVVRGSRTDKAIGRALRESIKREPRDE